jgi:hypothetical protein
LDWIGLDWIGLDWIGLDWIGLDWIGLDWIGLDWIGLDWIGLDWIRLDWTLLLGGSSPLHTGQLSCRSFGSSWSIDFNKISVYCLLYFSLTLYKLLQFPHHSKTISSDVVH